MMPNLRAQLRLDRSSWRILLAGLLVRLLLMPVAAHSDLLHTYWGANLIVYRQQLTLGLQAVLRLVHAAYLWSISFLLPSADSLWLGAAGDPLASPFFSRQVASTQGWLDFVSHAEVYRTLFLLKLPYLFFDLACVFLIYRLGSNRVESRRMAAFWWLNPILIFAVYTFGRHEVITLLFIILSLYLIQRGNWSGGLAALGVAIAVRYYAVLLLPFYVLSLRLSWKERVQALIIGLAPWLVINVVSWSLAGSPEAKGLVNLPHDNYLLAMKFQVATWDNLYIFPLLYFLLVLHRLYNRQAGLGSLVQYNLIALLLLYATAYTGQSPHYWTWYLPFLAVAVGQDRRLLPLHAAQILCLLVYSFIGGRATGGYLFAPIAPDFFWSLPSPVELMERFVSPEVVISLARTALSAITLWMAYLGLRKMGISFAFASDTSAGDAQ